MGCKNTKPGNIYDDVCIMKCYYCKKDIFAKYKYNYICNNCIKKRRIGILN